MDRPPSDSWTFAARARYFGDRICSFCDHRNPKAANFCNKCGSSLNQKPCGRCAAVNDHTAAICHKCGAEWPRTPAVPAELLSTDPALAGDPAGGDVAATVAPLPSATPTSSAVGHAPRFGAFRWAAVALILIAAYTAYRVNTPTSVVGTVSDSIGGSEQATPTALAAVPAAMDTKPAAVDTTPLPTPSLVANVEPSKRASVPQRPAPERRQKPTLTTPPVRHRVATPVDEPAATSAKAKSGPWQTMHAATSKSPEPGSWQTMHATTSKSPEPGSWQAMHATTSKSPQPGSWQAMHATTSKSPEPDSWQAMHASLARCDGDLIARMLCDQRVRRQFCDGHWGEPQCASTVVIERGQ